jgi:hypothetical protein
MTDNTPYTQSGDAAMQDTAEEYGRAEVQRLRKFRNMCEAYLDLIDSGELKISPSGMSDVLYLLEETREGLIQTSPSTISVDKYSESV